MHETLERKHGRLPAALESLGLFALGFALMMFFYHWSVAAPGDEIGAPGHDSFYHTKMAALLPEVGLLQTFPWLEYVYFTQEGHDFVSHHTGFHMLLMPFVRFSNALTGDYLAGARWAICTFFGINLVLFNLILRAGRVPHRWLWLTLFLLLPHQFYIRHAFIRAIGASLMIMQLLVLLLIRRRYLAAGLAAAAYIHLYLGAVMYVPVIVALFAAASVFGPREDRTWPWRMVAFTFAGWLLGVLTYPYSAGMAEFLKLQVTGSGLSPDIAVGREWKPYTDPWWFAQMAGTLLLVWAGSLVVRLRSGPRLSATELALLLLNFAFLVLTLKARRFIEYWPPVCLASAAYLAAPVLAAWTQSLADFFRGSRPQVPVPALATATLGGLAVAGALSWHLVHQPHLAPLLAEWRLWAWVLPLLALWPLTRVWTPRRDDVSERGVLLRLAAIPLSGLFIVGAILAVARWADAIEPLPVARVAVPTFAWILLVVLYMAAPPAVHLLRYPAGAPSAGRAGLQTLGVAALLLSLFCATAAYGGRQFVDIARQLRCNYDLAEVRRMMAFLTADAQPGDIVFTDDWDIFPLYFYHNTHNHYIVGLDPKFTHERRPDLWERYVKISRGQTPTRANVRLVAADGTLHFEQLDVALEDIRSEFGARYVITDRDHRALAAKLSRAPELAELVYPCRQYHACRDATFLVFRIRTVEESARYVKQPPQADEQGRLYLSQLNPSRVEQGWGELALDAAVDNPRLRLRGHVYHRGLGTHAPSTLLFDVPAEFDEFVATLGVDDQTNGEGSVVASVLLDGVLTYRTPILTGTSEPVTIQLPLNGARQIALRAEPTEDGNRFDHVDWADAHFVRQRQPAPAGEMPTTEATLAEQIRRQVQP